MIFILNQAVNEYLKRMRQKSEIFNPSQKIREIAKKDTLSIFAEPLNQPQDIPMLIQWL